MILINQHFRECHFCGRKFPPLWSPHRSDGKLYCSEKCVQFESKFFLSVENEEVVLGNRGKANGRSSRC
jgi:hypothetical protein